MGVIKLHIRSFILVLVTFSLTFLSAAAYCDQLVLYSIPSPNGLNWRTPHTLLKTILRNHNSGQPHEIGHVYVGVYCSSLGMKGEADVLTGMTSAVDNSQDLLLGQGYGLGLLFHNYEGRLNSPDEVTTDIRLGVSSGRLSFMAFDIAPEACQRLLSYEMEYRQRGYDRNYGLPNRPLYGEGSGCTAFGVSFLEVAGVDPKLFFHHWGRSLLVPRRLVGGPLTGDFIPITRILLNPFLTWADSEEPHFPISFWDPDRMHDYVAAIQEGTVDVPFAAERLTWGQAKGFKMDLRSIATPTGPIFKN